MFASVRFNETAVFLRCMSLVLYRRRDHAQHRSVRGVGLTNEYLQPVVEACRVAHALFQQANSIRQSERLPQNRFPGPEPTPISTYRVDLAVVCHQAERLGQRPTRLRIGRVALMKDGERTLELRAAQVRAKRGQLFRRQ